MLLSFIIIFCSLDTVVTIMSLFYPVLLYVFYHTTWVNYYLDTLFSHLGNYTYVFRFENCISITMDMELDHGGGIQQHSSDWRRI